MKHAETCGKDDVETLNETRGMRVGRVGHGPRMVARSHVFLLTGQHLSKETDGAVLHATSLLLPHGPMDNEKT